MLATCADESVLGVPFYVMEEMHGRVVATDIPQPLDNPGQRRRIGEELVDRLVELHAVDWRACGLEGSASRPATSSASCAASAGCGSTTRRASCRWWRRSGAGSPRTCPSRPPSTVVHGDYRLGNVMVAADAPARIVAILDWELSTIGDPLADLGYLVATWAEADDPGHVLRRLSAATGARASRRATSWSRATRSAAGARWRPQLVPGAGALEGRRVHGGQLQALLDGRTDDPYLAAFDQGVPLLAEKARAIALALDPRQLLEQGLQADNRLVHLSRGPLRASPPCRRGRSAPCGGGLKALGAVAVTSSRRLATEAESSSSHPRGSARPTRASEEQIALVRRQLAKGITANAVEVVEGPDHQPGRH